MADLLLIIDVQRGFINEWTRHIPDAVEALQHNYARVIVTRFHNPEGSPHRRLIGWQRFEPGSEDTELAFTPREDAIIIDKNTYTCVSVDLLADFRKQNLTEIHLCGIATDNCVLKTAVDLFEAGFTPVVLAAACASHGGPEAHDCGIRLLKRFIGEKQVRE